MDTVNESSSLDHGDEILEKSLKKKKKCYVHYPVENWTFFNLDSTKHFVGRHISDKMKPNEFKRTDFQILYTIGIGENSRVLLTKWKQSKLIAVKIKEKRCLVESGKSVQANREIRLLNFIKYPFVMSCCVVQSNSYLYHIMSFACGNSVEQLIKTRILTEKETKFYSSQVLLALEYLHGIGIVHRNIEAANVLICHDGYVKLTGFSKCKIGKFPDNYPQTLINHKYHRAYDLWSFGVLIYYLNSSDNPFADLKKETMPFGVVETPEYFSRRLRDLIVGLLECHGYRSVTAEELKSHEWFDLPWTWLQNKMLQPPFLPECKKSPVRHFNTFPTVPLIDSTQEEYTTVFKNCFKIAE